jgi:hypothetical protein
VGRSSSPARVNVFDFSLSSKPALGSTQLPDMLWGPPSLRTGSGVHPTSRPALGSTQPPEMLWGPPHLQTGSGVHPASRPALGSIQPPDILWSAPNLQTGSGVHPTSRPALGSTQPPNRLWGPPKLLTGGYQASFPGRKATYRGVRLTIHLQLVSQSRKQGSLQPLSHSHHGIVVG